MNQYLVGFNAYGTLVEEQVEAENTDQAKIIAQPKHPDLPIIAVKWLKP